MVLYSFGDSFVSFFLRCVDVVRSKCLYPVHDFLAILTVFEDFLLISLIFL